jgi:hypothetical protein
MKANNRAMIRIRAIPFCQVSKQGIRREGNAIARIGKGGLCIGDQIERPQTFSSCGLRVKIECL